jgi:hypothetical protein
MVVINSGAVVKKKARHQHGACHQIKDDREMNELSKKGSVDVKIKNENVAKSHHGFENQLSCNRRTKY